jgi:hypothetical protein
MSHVLGLVSRFESFIDGESHHRDGARDENLAVVLSPLISTYSLSFQVFTYVDLDSNETEQ